MSFRKFVLAALFALSVAPSFAQAPPPVPALPDTERRTSYSITSTTCTCAVNFALYGDATDYQNWIEVFLNGVYVAYNDPTFGWTITSPTGPLATIPRPITDAVLTFNSAQTGTVQIVGARRPRRPTQFSENRGVPARDLNQSITDITAVLREMWDKTNDVSGRAILAPPGETLTLLPPQATRAGKFLTFDLNGNPAVTSPGLGSGNVIGTGPTVIGHLAVFGNTAGTAISDGGVIPPASTATYQTRAAAVLATIPSTANSVIVEGYSAIGDGGAGTYIRLAGAPGSVRNWHFQSADGAWWQLVANPVFPRQVGAALNGSTDDSVAMQAWLDYGATFNVVSQGQSGTAAIPTATLNLSANQVVDGVNALIIQRQSNVVASLLDCNTHNNVVVRNTTFDTTAGFTGTGSNTIGLTSQTYTVPAGLNLVVNNFVQITANTSNAARINYEIGQITAYNNAGGSNNLTVTATTAVGSGTFGTWLIDVYPQNGDLAASNIALRFTACNNVLAEGNTATNRWYNAYDSRNGNDVTFSRNTATGYVNRGIHAAAYLSGNGAINNKILYNHLIGSSFSQYGINTSASDGAVAAGFTIAGNRVEFTNFQGIIIAGGITSSSVTSNSISMALNTIGVGIALENLVGSAGNQLPQYITTQGNTINGGFQGIFVSNVFYSTFAANTVTSAGTGVYVSGTPTNSTVYNTFTGNIVQASTSHGYQFSSSGTGGVQGLVVVGNSAIANGGWGFIADANTSNSNYSANASLGNTSGGYSFSGTGSVYNGTNL